MSADQYDGPATLVVDGAGARVEICVDVRLRGHLEPVDGRFHWWGRIAGSPEVDTVARSGATAALRTPAGEATGRLSDPDPWGRFRITGVGRPPF